MKRYKRLFKEDSYWESILFGLDQADMGWEEIQEAIRKGDALELFEMIDNQVGELDGFKAYDIDYPHTDIAPILRKALYLLPDEGEGSLNKINIPKIRALVLQAKKLWKDFYKEAVPEIESHIKEWDE